MKMDYERIFLFADPHFYHKNIIGYENRPFKDVYEMNDIIISNWNKVVKKQDKVFLAGDVSFANKMLTEAIINQLNGDIVLILGNHDLDHSYSFWKTQFKEVSKYPIILDKFFIISHHPMYLESNSPYANIYGHVHSDDRYKDYTNNTFCVSAERINYTPISLAEIITKMKNYEP
jgi:calcineurin-like phosphoesterase family protein|nr:MAG TPA: metallophosphatase domain protein [Crassvirales sp.]